MKPLPIIIRSIIISFWLLTLSTVATEPQGEQTILHPASSQVITSAKAIQAKYISEASASEVFYVEGQAFTYTKGEPAETARPRLYSSASPLPPPADVWVLTKYQSVESISSFGYLFVWSARVTWSRGNEIYSKMLNAPCLYVVTDVLSIMSYYGGSYQAMASTVGGLIAQIIQDGAYPLWDYINFDNTYDLLLLAGSSVFTYDYEDQFFRMMRLIASTRPSR